MGRGSGSITQTMALIAAICLLWVYPFCLFHEVSTGVEQRVTTSDLDHGSSPPAVCDAHLLNAAVIDQETDISAKAGVSIRIPHRPAVLHDQFSGVRRYARFASHPIPRSPSPVRSKELYVLHAVYQI